MAVRQASGEIDRETLRQEAELLTGNFATLLAEHRVDLLGRVEGTFKEYLDPADGRFQERAERLVGKDGELERLIKEQIVGEHSQLAVMLAEKLGAQSEIMRRLDPEGSEGVVRALSVATEAALDEQKRKLLAEFSLDNEQSALNRLAKAMATSNGELGEQVEVQVGQLLAQLSLDNDGSAMTRMKTELLKALESHEAKIQDMQGEIKAAAEGLRARRQAAAASTLHGLEFEDMLMGLIGTQAQAAGDLIVPTGAIPGRIRHCKKGDALITLGPDKAAAGARIVVEAKDKSNYSLADAVQEIAEARNNRDAQIGVFVYAEQNCPQGLDRSLRIGTDIFTVWDPEDPQTEVYVQAALSVATALCTTACLTREADEVDVEAIEKAILEIEKQVELMGEIETSARTIESGAHKILERVRKSTTALRKQCDELREKTVDVKDLLAHLGAEH